jgi:hypothetical protein
MQYPAYSARELSMPAWVDDGVEWKRQMWMGCKPCWRGRVYAYMEQRKAKQNAADAIPEHAIGRTQKDKI